MYVNELQFNIFVLPLFSLGVVFVFVALAEKDVIDHQITDFSYKRSTRKIM